MCFCLRSWDVVIDYDRAFSLPAYRAVSHVWLKSNWPSQDLFNPNHILSASPPPLQHSVHVIHQSLYLRLSGAWSQAPRWQQLLVGFTSASSLGTTGHRAADIQSHVTVWGLQTSGRSCTRRKQALTATLTNNPHICRSSSYLYQLKPSNNQVTAWRWSKAESKDSDMKH